MKQYLNMLQRILDEGYDTLDDRTGTGTRAVFGHQMRFDLQEGFPLVTTKFVSYKNILHELLWMLRGETNIKTLVDNGCYIWSEWPARHYAKVSNEFKWDSASSEERKAFVKEFNNRIKEDINFARDFGDLGPVYGKQWRFWPYHDAKQGNKLFDQLAMVIHRIKTNPTCRRLIVSAWNAPYIEEMGVKGLPPCHFQFQFNIRSGEFLDCHMNIRSWDTFLGGTYNIAQYAFLTHIIAKITGYQVGHLVISSGNTHLYLNHIEQAKLQLTREPYPLPKLKIAKHDVVEAYTVNDFEIDGYKHHPKIKADVSV